MGLIHMVYIKRLPRKRKNCQQLIGSFQEGNDAKTAPYEEVKVLFSSRQCTVSLLAVSRLEIRENNLA